MRSPLSLLVSRLKRPSDLSPLPSRLFTIFIALLWTLSSDLIPYVVVPNLPTMFKKDPVRDSIEALLKSTQKDYVNWLSLTSLVDYLLRKSGIGSGKISSYFLQDSCVVRSIVFCYCTVTVPQQLIVASEPGLVLSDSYGHGCCGGIVSCYVVESTKYCATEVSMRKILAEPDKENHVKSAEVTSEPGLPPAEDSLGFKKTVEDKAFHQAGPSLNAMRCHYFPMGQHYPKSGMIYPGKGTPETCP
ncbi:hypothetical protein WISP_23681 [Willisornis vidua]|uniref:Uncharacterized protein n=1 Tax=Willisornis vidua TaxID=1566151 RepID=A0ABQ9DT47_9PASS|nr:hypothetical protein WISP_23681 [Willisornis vidua]